MKLLKLIWLTILTLCLIRHHNHIRSIDRDTSFALERQASAIMRLAARVRKLEERQ